MVYSDSMEGKEKPHVVMVIQARMRATRLPGKVLKPVLGRPLLFYLIERVKKVENIDEVVVATTVYPHDDPIADYCENNGIQVFRGDEENVLERYLYAARDHHADVVIRVTADCPLIDPQVIERVVQYFLDHDVDYVSNTLIRTYPRGMDTEVFSMQVLEKTASEATSDSAKEHVTFYMYTHPDRFRLGNVAYHEDASKYRLTVDTEEDFLLVKEVLENLYQEKQNFTLEDVLDLLKKNPEMVQINAHIGQKPIKES